MINIFYTNNFHDFLFSIQVSEYLYSFVRISAKWIYCLTTICWEQDLIKSIKYDSTWIFYLVESFTNPKLFDSTRRTNILSIFLQFLFSIEKSNDFIDLQYRDGNLNLRLEPIRSDLLKLLWSWIEFYEWLRTACLL